MSSTAKQKQTQQRTGLVREQLMVRGEEEDEKEEDNKGEEEDDDGDYGSPVEGPEQQPEYCGPLVAET